MRRICSVLLASLLITFILIVLLKEHFIRTPLSSPVHTSSTRPSLAERLAHAELLWRKSVNNRPDMLNAYVDKNVTFPDNYIYPYNVFDFVRPTFFCPHDLERVGALGDGGKWVCGMAHYEEESRKPSSSTSRVKPLVVYSFGVGTDSSFEAEILQRTNAEIWGYDYSVDNWGIEIPEFHSSRAHFAKVKIGPRSDSTRELVVSSIQDLMKKNDHSYVDLVKMDIEGAEFDVMRSLVAFFFGQSEGLGRRTTLPIGQLVIEVHLLYHDTDHHVPDTIHEWLKWWEDIESLGLRPVSNEGNWIADVRYGRPRFMEYTMMNAIDTERNKLLWD